MKTTKYQVQTSLENIEQLLLENIADFLNSDSVELEMILSDLKDHEDLHINMCDAAMSVFRKETISK